ncbi:thymidylate kinase [Pelagibacteraceae bacterium GOM-A3]|nr:thymidylate kinase [Pelagibacteraceae bacterium GOM-A3]
MSKYPIIVFEGIEASGKSTSIKKVIKYFKKNKIIYLSFREPGGTNLSEKLRSLMLNKKSALSNKTDLFLLMASRSENIDKIIKENHKKKVILIDRFIDSTLAYQHYGMKLDKGLILKMNNFLLGNLRPNFTFLSIVNKKNMLNRLKLRKYKNKYDNFDYNFYNKVQKGFLKIANKNKSKYLILDTNKDNVKIIENKLINKIKKILN